MLLLLFLDRYNAMVADVTVAERKAADMKDAVLPTARLQIGFGLQVLVTMFTFFLLGYLGTKNLFSGNELWVRCLLAVASTLSFSSDLDLYR